MPEGDDITTGTGDGAAAWPDRCATGGAGRSGLRPQDAYAPRCDEVRFVSTEAVEPGTVLVRIAVPDAEVEVTVRRRRVDASGLTCAAPGPSWFVAHEPVALSEVEIG